MDETNIKPITIAFLICLVFLGNVFFAGCTDSELDNEGDNDSGFGFQAAKSFPMIIDGDGVPEESKQVKIPLTDLTNEAQFYVYSSNSVEIRTFALLGSNDKPRAAFDASESAYSEKKGFRQNGNKMVDNAGKWEFDIDTIGVLSTDNGYAPAFLSWDYCCGQTNIVINIKELKAHQYLFE